MILLALDQSSKITGYAIFDDGKLVKYGKLSYDDADLGTRLVKLRKDLEKLVDEAKIDEVIMEDIQYQPNIGIDTFKVLAETFGVVYELLTEKNIPNSSVWSTSWKSLLGIKGKTRPEQKRNAQNYIVNTFGIKPTQDECDAICIGLYKLHQKPDFDWSE
jgi:Holliday junction resolvasome RuvABC endonuclease subunit